VQSSPANGVGRSRTFAGDARERAGGDVRLGAVAAETPSHRERRRLLDAVHLIDRAVQRWQATPGTTCWLWLK
jgi:hypothetical protein